MPEALMEAVARRARDSGTRTCPTYFAGVRAAAAAGRRAGRTWAACSPTCARMPRTEARYFGKRRARITDVRDGRRLSMTRKACRAVRRRSAPARRRTATNAGRVSPVRGESVMALLLWRPTRVAGRFARGESVMASPPWRVAGGAGGSGAKVFRCDGDGGLSVIAEAMFACGGTFGRVWPVMRVRGRFYLLYCMLSIFAIWPLPAHARWESCCSPGTFGRRGYPCS